MRASEVIERLQRENADLEAYCETLKGALASHGVEDVPKRAGWVEGLTLQQCAFLGILYRAWPEPREKWAILEALPGRDCAVDRDVKIIQVVKSHICAQLGKDAVETVRGYGYRLGDAMYARMRGA